MATWTLMNFLRGMIGAGCLALPIAVKQAGAGTGVFMIFLLGLLNLHGMAILVRCAQHLCEKSGKLALDYGHLAKASVDHGPQFLRPHSKKALYATNTVIIILQSGSCAVQFVFMATHTKDVLEQYESNINWDPKIHLLLLLMPVILLTFIHSIQILSLLSTFGNLTMVVNFFIIIAVISGRKRELYSPSITTDLFSTILASGSILYAFEGQAMVLPMENKMSDPGAMLGCNGVLPTGMITVMSIYAFTGLFGYLAFGDHVKPSVTLNLDHNNIWFTVVKLALVVAVFIGLALRLFLIIQMLWPTIKRNLKHGLTRRYLVTEHVFRALFVTQTFLIAVAVPKLELIIPLVGVTGGMLLAFVFPALIELVTYWEDWKNTKMTALFVVKDIFLISVGIFGFIAGTYSNVHELAHHLSD